MKQKILLFTLSLGLGYLALSSYNTGAAANSQGDRTGRLGLTCAASNCHTSSGGATTCTIEVRKKSAGMSGTVVTQFIKDTAYTITVKGTNSTLNRFGFQLCAASGTGAAGTFSNLPAGTQSSSVSGFPVIEQSSSIAKNGAGNDSVTVEWKASSNYTSVTFYGIINAVNNDGTIGGDAVSAPATTVLQNAASVGTLDNNISFTTYPNPFTNCLKVKMEHVMPGNYTINAFDVHGKKLASNQVYLSTANNETTINTNEWPHGIFLIQTAKDGVQQTVQVIK
jgi:hypothetical protein